MLAMEFVDLLRSTMLIIGKISTLSSHGKYLCNRGKKIAQNTLEGRKHKVKSLERMLPCFIIHNEWKKHFRNLFKSKKTFPGYFSKKNSSEERNRLVCEKFMKQKSIKSLLWKHERRSIRFLCRSGREWNEINIFQRHDLQSIVKIRRRRVTANKNFSWVYLRNLYQCRRWFHV